VNISFIMLIYVE